MSIWKKQSDTSPRRFLGLMVLLCIMLQFATSPWLSWLGLGLWLASLAIFCRESLKRLWMPRFWLITLVFGLACGVFLGPRSGAHHHWWNIVSNKGLEAGLMMVLRGCFIFSLATWASMTFRQSDVERFARMIRVPRLGTALFVAFQLLPALKDRLQSTAKKEMDRQKLSPTTWPRLAGVYARLMDLIYFTACLSEELITTNHQARSTSPITSHPKSTDEPLANLFCSRPPN